MGVDVVARCVENREVRKHHAAAITDVHHPWAAQFPESIGVPAATETGVLNVTHARSWWQWEPHAVGRGSVGSR